MIHWILAAFFPAEEIVIMLMPLIMSSYATNLAYAGAGTMMGVNQNRMALADSMTGGESPAQVTFAGSMDRAYELQDAQAQMQFAVSQALQKNAEELRKKNLEHQQAMQAMGVVFG